MRGYFGHYRIDPALYLDKVTEDLSSDPDDRVHVAACIYGDVDVLLTRNIKHLRTPAVTAAGVKVITSDEFLSTLLARRRQAVVDSFSRAAHAKKDPPMGADELADRIGNAGASRFAERIRPYLH